LKYLASAVLVALAFVGAAWLYPRGMGLYYQVKGGMMLREVLQEAGIAEEIVCANDPLTDVYSVDGLRQAIENLEKAIGYVPELAQAYLLLGRAKCALGVYEEASQAYKQYTEMIDYGLIGHLEIGFAYEALGRKTKDKTIKDDVTSAWKQANLDRKNFLESGNHLFNIAKYEQALRWFERSSYVPGELSHQNNLFWAITEAAYNHSLPITDQQYDVPVVSVSNVQVTTIYPDNIYWALELSNDTVNFGDPLSKFAPVDNPDYGWIFWKGRVYTILNIHKSSCYLFTLSLHHFRAGDENGKLDIEIDLKAIEQHPLTDETKEIYSSYFLEQGHHLLSLNYIKDVGDILYKWIDIEPSSGCNKQGH
jgi:tetratricopeptide (TPR) repeat protein